MIVISNTGPLIHLAKLEKLQLLKQLFGYIYITKKIYEEAVIIGKKKEYEDAKIIENYIEEGWIIVIPHKPDQDLKYRGTLFGLDEGEIEAISLTRLSGGLLLSDEKKAREFATINGIAVMGTIRIIIYATKNSLISNQQATKLLRQLPDIMYISENIVEEAIRRLGNTKNI